MSLEQDHERLKLENEHVKARVKEDEKTLEELAVKLSNAELEIDSLKEEHRQTLLASGAAGGGKGLASWRDDGDVHECPICAKDFNSISRRKVCQCFS